MKQVQKREEEEKQEQKELEKAREDREIEKRRNSKRKKIFNCFNILVVLVLWFILYRDAEHFLENDRSYLMKEAIEDLFFSRCMP